MNRTTAITRRRILELFGGTSLLPVAMPYGRAAHDKMKKSVGFFFSPSPPDSSMIQ
jgi:hypothetical protein